MPLSNSLPPQRAAFLDKACPASDLRCEIESLLSIDPDDGSLFNFPAWEKRLAPGADRPAKYSNRRLRWDGTGLESADTRLGRDVAIKVYADRFSDHFRREAAPLQP